MTTRDWKAFVLEHGWRVRGYHLAHILQQPVEAIERARQAGCRRGPRRPYVDLFARWHGRPPGEEDWPAPRKNGGGYEWLVPEEALLARLVGTMSATEIARILTDRLQRVTGDPQAQRCKNHVQIRINLLGLLSTDVVGGLTVRDAAARVGSVPIVQQAITDGKLRTFRVGRLHVIPREAFDAWYAQRDQPPPGWVGLSAALKQPLGIRSDSKLPEFATYGYIPNTVLVRSTHKWFIDPTTARQIIADARAGRELPWHGMPMPDNLRAGWKKWNRRKHRQCETCRQIWGWRGEPRSLQEFCERYPWLDLGMKRHLTSTRNIRLTRPWRPWGNSRAFRAAGVSVAAAALELGRTPRWVLTQIRRGVIRPLRDALGGEAVRISPAAMRTLRSVRKTELRGRPTGTWMGLFAAGMHAGVTTSTVHRWGCDGKIQRKAGVRGFLYSQSSLERQTRRYWARCRFKRAVPPAWLQAEAAA